MVSHPNKIINFWKGQLGVSINGNILLLLSILLKTLPTLFKMANLQWSAIESTQLTMDKKNLILS